jgi:tetratricopeptide (TPR) repeat protein
MRFCLLVLVAILAPAMAAGAELSAGFEHFYNLEFDEAIAEFRREAAAHPGDAGAWNHIAMSILFREMFRFGALESELVSGTNPFLRRARMNPSAADQQEFSAAVQKAMGVSHSRLERNPNDTQALYALGVSHGLRANYNFLVRKAYVDSLKDATAARKLHAKVAELEPSNVDARLALGVHYYVVGSLVWYMRAMGFLAGFTGDKERGIATLEDVARRGKINDVDAQIFLCAIYRRERSMAKAVPLLLDLIRRFPRNFLLRFELSQMYADLGDGPRALEVLREIERLRSAGSPGYTRVPLEKILFARGVVQFWYRDLDQAEANLKLVTQRTADLDLNTSTFAWLRLGQTYDLKGQRSSALSAYQQVLRLAPDSDAATISRKYLSSPFRRDR